jgi:hypothetical protein
LAVESTTIIGDVGNKKDHSENKNNRQIQLGLRLACLRGYRKQKQRGRKIPHRHPLFSLILELARRRGRPTPKHIFAVLTFLLNRSSLLPLHLIHLQARLFMYALLLHISQLPIHIV